MAKTPLLVHACNVYDADDAIVARFAYSNDAAAYVAACGERARRLVDTGSGATAKDAEPNADEMLLTVAHWTEHGDPSQPMPEDASDAVERLLILGYGPKWADACAKAVGR